MEEAHEKIEGWFSFRDARFYRYQLRAVDSPARFVEIGSYKGRSSYCMAAEIRRTGKPVEFWCVDGWEGSEEHSSEKAVVEGTLYDEFLANVEDVRDYIRPIRALSLDAATQFADESLDFVFIDGAHDYESVRADIAAWRPKVKPTGVLAGHDYSRAYPSIVAAVEEEFGGRTLVYGACWYIEAGRRAGPWSLLESSRKFSRQRRRRRRQPPLPSPTA